MKKLLLRNFILRDVCNIFQIIRNMGRTRNFCFQDGKFCIEFQICSFEIGDLVSKISNLSFQFIDFKLNVFCSELLGRIWYWIYTFLEEFCRRWSFNIKPYDFLFFFKNQALKLAQILVFCLFIRNLSDQINQEFFLLRSIRIVCKDIDCSDSGRLTL